MNKLFVILLLSLTLPLHAQQNVSTAQKYALVIGNSNYTSIKKLNNPGNDANGIKTELESLGWSVEYLTDANPEQTDKAVARLTANLSKSKNSYGFIFYSGHAVQSNGVNYLIPADANYQSEVILRSRALSVQKLLEDLNDAENELNIIVLDACRDNPFSWNKSGNRGLAAIQRQPANSVIAFTSSANSAVEEPEGKNGLYTAHLLNNLRTPEISVKELFDKTQKDVISASAGRQNPALYSQYNGTAFLGSKAAPSPSPSPAPGPLISLYERLVSATGTSVITVTQDTTFTSPITISVALSLTLTGDKTGRTILGAGYTSGGFLYSSSIIVERGVTLTLENITLFSVSVQVKQGGTLVMNNASVITGCLSCGVYVEGTFIMNKGSAVTNNGSSGVIISGGTFTMNDGKISSNNDQWGGGVNVNDKGTFNMRGGLIENNTASEHGGGVFVNNNSVFNMYGGNISRNRADDSGGGIYIGGGSILRMTGGVIHGPNSSGGPDTNTAKTGKAVYNDNDRRNKENNSTVTKF